jgi:DNA-binding YbaB/EbfC family protein
MIDPNMIRRLQKDLTDRMERMKEDLKKESITGTAGGGAVIVTCNGNSEVLAVKISPEAVDPDDVEMLQDLVLAAVNAALENARKRHEESVSQITGGIKLPGFF